MADFPAYFAVIGHPVGHSLSPVMHLAAFRSLGINACYTGYDVEPERLREVASAMRTLHFRGFNVTIPHKSAIMDLLDECTPEAVRIGAVNTVYVKDNRWIGDNTDGLGYLSSLTHELDFDVRGKRVMIFGAGGAARGIADALLFAGIDALWIVNRHLDKATYLAEQLAMHHISQISVLEAGTWPEVQIDLLINTTPVGMQGHLAEELPIATDYLNERMVVSDIVYRPMVTPLLTVAAKVGARTHGGLGMLVEQGALAFYRWFGVMPPVSVMREAALEAMQRERT